MDKEEYKLEGKFYTGQGALAKAKADCNAIYKGFHDPEYKIVVMVVEGMLFVIFRIRIRFLLKCNFFFGLILYKK